MLQGLTALFAAGALVWTGITATQEVDRQQTTLYRATKAECQLIAGILHTFATPRGRQSAQVILAMNPQLLDCDSYAAGFIGRRRGP